MPGGTIGRYMNVTVGAPSFNVGDEAVFFLTTRGRDLPAIFGLNQGVFRVSMEGASRRRIVTPPLMSARERAGDRRPGRPGAQAGAARDVRRAGAVGARRDGTGRAMRRAAFRERRSLAIVLLPLVVAAAVFASTPVLGYLKLGTRSRHAHGEPQVERFARSATTSPSAGRRA